MRTTLTLDPDVAALLKKRVAEGGVSFKDAVNEALRRGLQPSARPARPTWTQRLWPGGGSEPLVPIDDLKRLTMDEELEQVRAVARRQSAPVRD